MEKTVNYMAIFNFVAYRQVYFDHICIYFGLEYWRNIMKITPESDLQYILDHANEGDVLELAEGTYRIKCKIHTPHLTIRGAGADRTRIVWDDYAKKIASDGKEFNTFRTWTVAVVSDHVTMEDLSIINDAGHPELKGQEVALTVYGDDFRMNRCRLTSTQDTIFVGPLPDDLIERYNGFLTDDLRADKYCRQYLWELPCQ